MAIHPRISGRGIRAFSPKYLSLKDTKDKKRSQLSDEYDRFLLFMGGCESESLVFSGALHRAPLSAVA